MALLQAPARASHPTYDEPLVSPPDDVQKYWYLGRQHRWLLGLQGVSFALIAWSVLRFATADARLLLFLAPMTLYAVTLVVSLLSGTHRRQITLDGHVDRVASWQPAVHPSVDVFLPPRASRSRSCATPTGSCPGWPGRDRCASTCSTTPTDPRSGRSQRTTGSTTTAVPTGAA